MVNLAESRQNIYILSIVAIVAVVAIIALIISSMNAGTSTMQSTASDNSGQVYIAANAPSAHDYFWNLNYCIDTDPYQQFGTPVELTKGYVTGKDFFGNIYLNESDYCRNPGYNSSVLVEYSCQGLFVIKTEYNCSNGCLNGACMLCKAGRDFVSECSVCNKFGSDYVDDNSVCQTRYPPDNTCVNGACRYIPTCTPISCKQAGHTCGSLYDGCGKYLNCGACTGSHRCINGACSISNLQAT